MYVFVLARIDPICPTFAPFVFTVLGLTLYRQLEFLYDNIEPLLDFDWASTEPLKLRPFKPKYHLSMALENLNMSELVLMDKNYLERLRIRRKLLENEPTTVVCASETIGPAVSELYTWITRTYLPQRYPSMFNFIDQPDSKGLTPLLRNLVTNETLPTTGLSTTDALRTLGAHVDEDFLLLLPSPSTSTAATTAVEKPDRPSYRLEGFVNCFPSGFDTRAKFGRTLAAIHAPVPGYAAKLERSMDRFFAALPAGRFVKRHNWSLTTSAELFSLGGYHLYAGEDGLDEVETQKREKVDVEKCVLRCERQTLHRLRESGAVVFAFKTYVYPLKGVKEEGNGEALAQAIEGLGRGSVPEIEFYKRAVVWGEDVKAYLRS
ncbi:hypothetical protein BDY21DRAFT_385566 [Lineolata rhizophorae]|uniref:Uncharacterized protein n=1 Tax=Lineolata rhizophorae TaxID=578093 RepID=A0A6A6P1H0_9PEZI|nr:hypothetical protein BDY21DRAFT_385566 [Lineolata rhizophorae]